MVSGWVDLDLIIYFPNSDQFTARQMYEGVESRLKDLNYKTVRHNVAIRLAYDGFHVDVVPGRALDAIFYRANLYASERDTTKLTSLKAHIDLIRKGGNQDVVKVLKLWKRQRGLPIGSFVLELATISGLYGNRDQTWRAEFGRFFEWLQFHFSKARLVDPANSNNVVSDDLSALDKLRVQSAAALARSQGDWRRIVT